jgi:hypothetical protein
MNPAQFRRIALSLPNVAEGAHGGHPDFRRGNKIFASLGYPDREWGMVKLTPDQQALLIETTPNIFVPVRGTWGLRGGTSVRLAAANPTTIKHAMTMAWQNLAPKKKAGRARPAPENRKKK